MRRREVRTKIQGLHPDTIALKNSDIATASGLLSNGI
jgi:hypothetical protein